MNDKIDFVLNTKTIENLKLYSELLNKDFSTMLDEALEQYFVSEQEKLIAKEQNATNLDYNEFWDGVDV